MQRFLTTGLAAGLLASGATAQFHINEIYASHTGTDDHEYVELVGTPGAALDGYFVLVIEGDSSSAFGNQDRTYDLTGQTMPADGYFVLGGAAVANLDMGVGNTNLLENGTNTYFLIQTSDVDGVNAQHGTDIDTDDDGFAEFPAGTVIVDLVAPVDGGISSGDVVLNNAPTVGPDGSFLPAGIFCDGDIAGNWCTVAWLDFDDVANIDLPRTPGAANTTCPPPLCQTDLGSGGPGSSSLSLCGIGLLPFTGSDLVLSGAPANTAAILIISGAGGIDLPLFGGVFVSASNLVTTVNQSTDSNGEVTTSVPGSSFVASFVLQYASIDVSQPQFLSISNAVQADFGI